MASESTKLPSVDTLRREVSVVLRSVEDPNVLTFKQVSTRAIEVAPVAHGGGVQGDPRCSFGCRCTWNIKPPSDFELCFKDYAGHASYYWLLVPPLIG